MKITKIQNNQNYKTQNKQSFVQNPLRQNYSNDFVTFSGKKDYNQDEKEFAKFLSKLSKKFHTILKKYNENNWDFYINSTKENQEKLGIEYKKIIKLSTKQSVLIELKTFKGKKVNDENLTKNLDNLIKYYKNSIEYTDDLNSLQTKVNNIQSKFNNSRGEIDGKPLSNSEMSKLMETERNPQIRERLYYEKTSKRGDLIADDLIDLIKSRNEFAKKLGFDNYFSYMLKESYNIDNEENFYKLLDDLDTTTADASKRLAKRNNKKLAREFGISAKELQPYHYGLLLDKNPYLLANNYIKDNNQVLNSATKMYKRMGWNIPNLPLTLDLFPKPNKNQHGFCFDINGNKDVRILANLRNDLGSLETLNHELGHAVYDFGLSSKLIHLEKKPASSALTEAAAMLMESLPYRELSLNNDLNIPMSLNKKLEIKRKTSLIQFVRSSLRNINFEKELYKNPDLDPKELWYSLEHKFQYKNKPKNLDNAWASVPHFQTHPAYYQNYLRAEIMAAQIYEAATKKLGTLTENPKTAEYFKNNIFKFGNTLKDTEIIKNLSGYELSTTAFVKQFENLIKHTPFL